jgi:hypothetical protein
MIQVEAISNLWDPILGPTPLELKEPPAAAVVSKKTHPNHSFDAIDENRQV